MKIINLTPTQFKNYSNIHKQRNFSQTIEYASLPTNQEYEKYFLGLIDESRNLYGATLLLVKNISPTIKEAITPNGFLIDYSNLELVKTFTEELSKYLKKINITYLITNPMFKYKVYNKKNTVIENNFLILNHLIKLGYKTIGYQNEFSRFEVILENNSEKDIYKNFNRNTKRYIKESINLGLSLHKATLNELNTFYNIIKKKTNYSNAHYYNLFNTYNSNDNKMEIFFIKLNPERFLINAKKLYEKELKKNEAIHQTFKNKTGNITEKLLNKKMLSDNTLEKYHDLLNDAIELSKKEKNNIIIGTSAILKNNQEIYFLIDGYNEEYRKYHASHMLKWAIIKKYSKLGYNKFNLGEIHYNYLSTACKYHGQYIYKIGYGGNVIEYPPKLMLIINKPRYIFYTKLNELKKKLNIGTNSKH